MVVQLRKDFLAGIYVVILIVLISVNWVGIYERYTVNSYPIRDVRDIVIGDIDATQVGDEVALMTTSGVFLVGSITSNPWMNIIYDHSDWEINPLIALAADNFEPAEKSLELIALTANGSLLLIKQNASEWNIDALGSLPWGDPVWTTYAVASGQLNSTSEAAELVIVGEYFDLPTMSHLGQAIIVQSIENATWQIETVYTTSKPLLCTAIGNIDPTSPEEEIVMAGQESNVIALERVNETWQSEILFNWDRTIPAITIGNFLTNMVGYEIGLILGVDVFTLYKSGNVWTPKQIWDNEETQNSLQTVIACNIDPWNPGDEILISSTNIATQDAIFYSLIHNSDTWTKRDLLSCSSPPTTVYASNIDFYRDTDEVIFASETQINILAIPNSGDRTARAFTAVLLPALILLPCTIIIFAIADYISRVSAIRRRNYALQMAAKGFARCPYCKRFVPKDKMKAHRRTHQQR
jgi:hypothetical protein